MIVNNSSLPNQLKCQRCGHLWWPRKLERPRICPKCKTPYWDSARTIKGKETGTENLWLENARKWLRRSHKDLAGFKALVRFNKQNYRNVRCSDPALAVYLLQQALEKAVKAVAIASSQYLPTDIKKAFSHNSFDLLMDFYSKTLSQIHELNLDGIYMMMAGITAAEADGRISVTHRMQSKHEMAMASPDVVETFLRRIESIRKSAILDTLRDVFGPHTKIKTHEVNRQAGTIEDTVSTFEKIWTTNLGQPPLTDEQLALATSMADKFTELGHQLGIKGETSKFITVDRSTKTWLSVWALVALMILAYLTTPHESSSRYPRLPQVVKGSMPKDLDCDDYDQTLGIVKHLGYAGYVTELVLGDIDEILDGVSLFFKPNKAVQVL